MSKKSVDVYFVHEDTGMKPIVIEGKPALVFFFGHEKKGICLAPNNGEVAMSLSSYFKQLSNELFKKQSDEVLNMEIEGEK